MTMAEFDVEALLEAPFQQKGIEEEEEVQLNIRPGQVTSHSSTHHHQYHSAEPLKRCDDMEHVQTISVSPVMTVLDHQTLESGNVRRDVVIDNRRTYHERSSSPHSRGRSSSRPYSPPTHSSRHSHHQTSSRDVADERYRGRSSRRRDDDEYGRSHHHRSSRDDHRSSRSSYSRYHSRSPPHHSSRRGDSNRDGGHRRNRSRSPINRSATAVDRNLSQFERDMRTVFVTQFAARLTANELLRFFETAGPVQDVQLVSTRTSKRSRGIAYVEFVDEASVEAAVNMNGQLLHGIPIIVQYSEVHKNLAAEQEKARLAAAAASATMKDGTPSANPSAAAQPARPPRQLPTLKWTMNEYEISEELKRVGTAALPAAAKALSFMDDSDVFYDPNSPAALSADLFGDGMSSSFGNGTDLMSVPSSNPTTGYLDDEFGSSAIMSRADLMAKLASRASGSGAAPVSRCILLCNVFDFTDGIAGEQERRELEEDVRGECTKFGKIVHLVLSRQSLRANDHSTLFSGSTESLQSISVPGVVYIKYVQTASASKAIEVLNGRFFGGRKIEVKHVDEILYNSTFPEAMKL